MKSRALKLYDYREIPLEKADISEDVKEEVASLVRSITRHYKQTVNAESIERGDVALLESVSDTPKFNRPKLPVNVGKGLLDAAFEEALIGLGLGETRTVTAGTVKATVTTLSIRRSVYPELTDEMVREQIAEDDEDYGGIQTAAEFLAAATRKISETLMERTIYNSINGLLGEVFEKSAWEFDEAELKAYADFVYKTETGYLLQEGIDVEAFSTEDEYVKAFGDIHSREELLEIVDQIARDTVATELMYCAWLGIDPETVDVFNEEERPDMLNTLYEYVKGAITE